MLHPLQLDPRVLDRARISRDARFDGKFFIAVTSTGIYCRPICPSRTSKPENVRYYTTAAAAAEAGFRPCLRCRPEAAPGTAAWLGTSAVVNRALRMINDGVLDGSSVESLAARLGVGPRHLHRLFIRHVGASPVTVAQTRRLHFAKRLLDESHLPITQIALASGFGSVRRFNDAFRATYRRSPRELRSQIRTGNRANATDEVMLKLPYRPPYAWSHMVQFLGAVAIDGVERVTEYCYTRTLTTLGGHALVSVQPSAGDHSLELRIYGAEPSALAQIATNARRVFDLTADCALIDAALGADPWLRESVRRRPGLRIPGAWDPFECAVWCLLSEASTDEMAHRLLSRLVSVAGGNVQSNAMNLSRTFPTPAAILSAELDAISMPAWQRQALQRLARTLVATGHSPYDSERVMHALSSLPRVSDRMLHMMALRSLSEPDAFPIDRVYGSLRALGEALPSSSELARRAEAWRPWRGYAAMHLWTACSDPG